MKKQAFRPFAHAIDQLVSGILNGEFAPGSDLPAERQLAQDLGITRPTLREALQVLAAEGWFQIRHGKPTRIADFMDTGSLALLSRLASYPEHIPHHTTGNLLEVRSALLPVIAGIAYENDIESIIQHLKKTPTPQFSPEEWTRFDWELQILMLEASKNPIFRMIFNGFKEMYHQLGILYFSNTQACESSSEYYQLLRHCKNRFEFQSVVSDTMQKSRLFWDQIQAKKNQE